MAQQGSKRISTFGSRFTSIVSVTLVLLLLGIVAMVAATTRTITDDVRRNLGFTIIMEREAPDIQVNALKQSLLANSGVDRVEYLSSDDILAQEREYLGNGINDELDINPYAAEIEVKVHPDYASPDSIDVLTAFYSEAEGVEDIITESAVISGVESTLSRLRNILLIIAGILLLVSIALINNTVSLSIYSRRFLIHTMKLVGATAGFIRRPFIIAGAINGFIAGFAASALLCGVRAYGATLDPLVSQALPWLSMAMICSCLLVAGILLCALTAAFATNRFVDASYDEMFLK